jgi:hypothetical protein
MKVIERATMPNGTKIIIEDWREDYSFINTLNITAFPIMQTAPKSKKLYFTKPGETFRAEISRGWENNDEVYAAFESLKNGQKNLIDYADQFREAWAAECL